MALTINRLGMSLMRMGKASENVRFLDEIDLTFSLDSRKSTRENMTSMELMIKPIVFRASYRDIELIMTIVNRAVQLYGQTASTPGGDAIGPGSSREKQQSDAKSNFTTGKGVRSQPQPVGQARVLMSKEHVRYASSVFISSIHWF